MNPETWTGQAIGGAVWWALTRLLTDPAFWTGLIATALGVGAAFYLQHWRDRRHAQDQYVRTLNAVRYESAALHAICTGALADIPGGTITSAEVDAPALRGLVAGPMLHEHASHGLTVVLGSLLAFVGAAHNSLDHYRRMVTSAGFSLTLPTPQLAPLTKRLSRLQRGIESAQGLMDRELRRLQRGVIRTEQDQQDVQAFRDATQ